MFLVLIASSLLAISSSSWVIIWVFIEVNTLAICSILSNEINEENESNTQALIYLIVQLSSSIIFLVSIYNANDSDFWLIASVLAVLIKTGSWPTHIWYLNTLSMLNTNHNTISILMTWQNLLPLIILPYINVTLIILISSVMSILTPINKINNGSSFNTIIGVSSLNSNGWITLIIILSCLTFLSYYVIYCLSLVLTLSYFNNSRVNTSTSTNNFWQSFIILGNIGGIPPFIIFLGKLLIFNTLLIISTPNEFTLIIILIACYFIYHYTWTTLPNLSNIPNKSQLWNNENSYSQVTTLILSSILTFIFMLLGLTSNGFTLIE